jgi:hypothetical protein
MTLVSILGDMGSGKTLLATYFALNDKRKVYSNYEIKIKNYRDLKPEMLAVMNEPSLIIIDEAYTWIESRRSGSDPNQFFSYILFQSRKREMDILLTNQLRSTIDVRFRNLTNYEIYAQHLPDIGFEYYLIKKSSFNTYRPMRFILPYKLAEKIYPKYNSWELINPIDDNLLLSVSEDKSSIIAETDSHVDKLLKKAPANKYTRGIIVDYCLRNNLPKVYIDMIFNAIKASSLKYTE